LEQEHQRLFQAPVVRPVETFQPTTVQSNQGYVIVSVATYGAYQPPIEGWSQQNAGLGGSTK